MEKVRRSKYGFASLEVGDSFDCKALDLASMQSCLSKYNKKHGTKIKLCTEFINDALVKVIRKS